jgi:hypothetical protein
MNELETQPLENRSERIVSEIKSRAAVFVLDNFVAPTPADFILIENAMLIGSSIALESELSM